MTAAMKDLKGLILSGGKGTRLRPITYTSAKQLVPVVNKPVLFYGIESLAAAGIRDVGIIVAPETADEIRSAVGDGSRFGVSVTYIPQEAPLGLAHALLTAEDFLGGAPFVMYLGDNLLRDGITDLVDRYSGSGAEFDPMRDLFRGQVPKRVRLQFVERRRVTWDHRKLAGVY